MDWTIFQQGPVATMMLGYSWEAVARLKEAEVI
jgi:hypothetical protein